MCGICGIYSHRSEAEVDAGIVKKMADAISHRGPDQEGFFIRKHIGLGHRRLSIIDKAGGGQPMFNETGKIAIVFNGEIYNHHELRKELSTRGHVFQTHSDTEAIIHAYEQWDLAFVKRLRGMFAFAIWDEDRERLVLARDRVGIKPLLYAITDRGIVFGSEMKAILAAGVPHTISSKAISDYLTYRYVPAPATIFHEINRLLPGYMLVATKEHVTVQEYWDLDCSQESTESADEISQKLRSLLQQTVGSHLESEVPLGAFLSGGVDSSAVVAFMAQQMNSPVQTYTIGFADKDFDESAYAKRVAERYHTDHHERILSNIGPQDFDILLEYFDEPFADSSSIPTFAVCREAAKDIIVVLSGDGGDENFAGYRRYSMAACENWIRPKFPRWMQRSLLRFLAWAYPKADWLPQIFRGKSTFINLSVDSEEAHYYSMSSVREPFKKMVLSPEVQRELKGYRSLEEFHKYYARATCPDLLKKIFYTDIKMYLSGDILTKVDMASMAHSLEVRVPILDHLVIEYAFQIPTQLKLQRTCGKYIFKKMLEEFLDRDILYRRKMGFSIPLASWLRKDLCPIFESRILHGEHLPYFDYKAIERLYREHLSKWRNNQEVLWNILVFHRWYDRWVRKLA